MPLDPNMPTILENIVNAKKLELGERKRLVPLEDLEQRIEAQSMPLNLSGALMGNRIRLIGEIKKASPSRGILAPDFNAAALSKIYVNNGAAAVSVLTDPRFMGTLKHLQVVKETIGPLRTPVLRKDFIFDPYQVYEARAYGADALLLIVAILPQARLKELLSLCQKFWLQPLVETHNEEEIRRALDAGAEIIGINNRNLHTFETNISVTERLVHYIPSGKIIVSESGISRASDVLTLRGYQVNAVLVGEALVTARDIGAKVRELTLTNAPKLEDNG